MEIKRREGKDFLITGTYNVHGHLGIDLKFRPKRIAKVIQQINPHIMALQEVLWPLDEKIQFEFFQELQERLHMQVILGSTMQRPPYFFGNILLTKLKILETKVHDISVKGREPRNFIETSLEIASGRIHVLATHLGLARKERYWQFNRLFEWFDHNAHERVLILGDLNQPTFGEDIKKKLLHHSLQAVRRPSFPSWYPLFALDQIWHKGMKNISQITIHRNLRAMVASDHLPLLAHIHY